MKVSKDKVNVGLLAAAGVVVIVYALSGCSSKGPNAKDKAYLAGCNDAAHALLESLGIRPAEQAKFDDACAKLLEGTKQQQQEKR